MLHSSEFLKYAQSIKNELVSIRRHLHQYPELSFEEFATTQFIEEKLSQWGIKNIKKPLKTGIVGILNESQVDKNVVALRADIDALPIEEKNTISYKSKNKGIMHACGHDVHTTCLLGAIKILHSFGKNLEGAVTFIFQPGEEKNPGGASLILESGILEKHPPQSIFGIHVDTSIDVGKVGYLKGKCMASADELHISVKGEGGHAAYPHLQSDTIVAASQLILTLQNVVSRNANPFDPSVLSICSINGGFTTNVIPEEVKIKGTFRAMNEEWRKKAHRIIQEYCDSTAKTFKVKIDLLIDIGYPMVFNDEELTENATLWLQDLLGEKNVVKNNIRMGAEDFGFYSQKYKTCFLRLGVKGKNQKNISGVHHPMFNIDEDALVFGAASLAWLAFSNNNSQQKSV